MSETPDQPTARDRPEPSRTDDATEHEPLDVAEWVSELRRLYVEPTTNAEQHRESGMAPLRRMLHLRGSRHVEPSVESHPAPELSPMKPSPTSLRGLAQRADPVSDPAERHPEPAASVTRLAEAGSEPIVGSPQVDEASGETEDPSSAAWLFSYLEATGASTKDEGAPVGAAGARPDQDVPADDAVPEVDGHVAATEDEPEAVQEEATDVTVASDIEGEAASAPELEPSATLLIEPETDPAPDEVHQGWPEHERGIAYEPESESESRPEPEDGLPDSEPSRADGELLHPSSEPMDDAPPEHTAAPASASAGEPESRPASVGLPALSAPPEAVGEGEPEPEPAEWTDEQRGPEPAVDELDVASVPSAEPEPVWVAGAESEPVPDSVNTGVASRARVRAAGGHG